MLRGTAAKNVRRKSAIERIERNVEAYNRLIPTLSKSNEDEDRKCTKSIGTGNSNEI